MALDFVIGESRFIKDGPIIFQGIIASEFETLGDLDQLFHDHWVIRRLANVFDVQVYSVAELEDGLDGLLDIVPQALNDEQRKLLFKLISVFAYAHSLQKPLWANSY